MLTSNAINQSLGLPDLFIESSNDAAQRETLLDKVQGRIEKDIVVNISFLVGCLESRQQAFTSAIDCFADAFGMNVGFSDLGL